MSRVLGRAMDVLQIVNYLQDSEIPKYITDKSITTWEAIEQVPNKLKIYLPDSAIDFINKEKIQLKKNPLRKYVFTSVPDYPDEKRYIVFPSLKPRRIYERDYAFYLGLLLSSYKKDNQEELLENCKEYDDLLALLIDYLYLKANGREEDFSLKYLFEIKYFSKYFGKIYEAYEEGHAFSNSDEIDFLSDQQYERYLEKEKEYDEDMEKTIMEDIVKLSAFEATLQITDLDLDNDQIKKLINDLMINEGENRSSVLYDRGIDSYGYKRMKKEIDKYNRKK